MRPENVHCWQIPKWHWCFDASPGATLGWSFAVSYVWGHLGSVPQSHASKGCMAENPFSQRDDICHLCALLEFASITCNTDYQEQSLLTPSASAFLQYVLLRFLFSALQDDLNGGLVSGLHKVSSVLCRLTQLSVSWRQNRECWQDNSRKKGDSAPGRWDRVVSKFPNQLFAWSPISGSSPCSFARQGAVKFVTGREKLKTKSSSLEMIQLVAHYT